MKRLTLTLLLCLLLTLPALAQTPEPTAVATPDGTLATPTPEVESTADTRLLQIVVGLIPDLTEPIIETMTGAFERSQWMGVAMWGVFGVVMVVVVYALYRSTPESKKAEIGVELAAGTSTVIKQIDAADPIKWTDIDNRILKVISGYLDDRITNLVTVGVQAGIAMSKESERATETAQGLNAAVAPKPTIVPAPTNSVDG
jgi:hypothetical protein